MTTRPNPTNERLLRTLTRFLALGVLFLCLSCTNLDQSPHKPIPTLDGDAENSEADGENALFGTVSIEVIPPVGSGFLTEQFRALDLARFDGTLTLTTPLRLDGSILRHNLTMLSFDLSLLRIGPSTSILGHPLAAVGLSTNDGLVEGLRAGLFTVSLLPGQYRLLIEPQGENGLLFPITRIQTADFQKPRVQASFLASSGRSLCGLVRDGKGAVVPDVEVAASGQLPGARSSRTTTASSGVFCISVADNEADSYDIRIGPTEQAPLLPTRSFAQVFVQGVASEPVVSAAYLEEGKLVLRYDDFDRADCYVAGRVLDQTQTGVGQARVALSAPIGGGRLTVNTTTDSDGKFTARLLREAGLSTKAYSLRVLPPNDSDAAILPALSFTCDQEFVALESIVLATRLSLGGTIRDKNGAGVAGVTLIASKQATSEDSLVYVKKTSSNAAGEFLLRLDAGTYDLSVQPPAASGLGWQVLSGLQTSVDMQLPITLFPGVWLKGTLRDSTGTPVPWAYIDVYRERPALAQSEKIAAGQSDGQGRFQLLLPR